MSTPPDIEVILVAGVSGSGKTTVGGLLAERLGWDYAEADAFHASIREHYLAMARGNPQRYLVLDGTRPPDELHAQVLERVEALGIEAPGVDP